MELPDQYVDVRHLKICFPHTDMASQKEIQKDKNTRIIRVGKQKLDHKLIREAAALLRSGELIAFPTETVYGLGANGLREDAVRKIFAVKGRPPDNPLILHVGFKKDILLYGRNISPSVKKLIHAFWPGPLTIIVKKRTKIPDIVTAGLDTLALRMPANSVALALIRAARVPVAAPSANVSGKPSPTTASHVYQDLFGKVEIILDGGKTDVGIESTIIDCTVEPPAILRPGKITRRQIENTIGFVDNYLYNSNDTVDSVPKSPGLKYRHYAPDVQLILVEGDATAVKATIDALIRQYHSQNKRVGILAFFPGSRYTIGKQDTLVNLGLRKQSVSRRLFETLRYFDEQKVDVILAENFPSHDQAIMNRLRKAASEIIVAQA